MFTFKELQDETKRSAARDKSGTEFDTPIKNAINRSIYRIAREYRWRSLRRQSSFNTVTAYTEGTGAVTVTEDSADVTVTGATFITDGVIIGRRIDLGGSNKKYRIDTITGEDTLTVDQLYDGDDSTTQSYSIFAQGTYNLPIQASHEVILWHEQYGHPMQLAYMTSQETFGLGLFEDTTNIVSRYRMWGEDTIITQLRDPSIVSAVSSSASDTTQQVTIFGTVSGFPDFETLSLNGTTAVNGSKSFSSVERIVGNGTARVGRVTVSGNSAGDTLAVLPVGNTTREIMYRKVQVRPLPNAVYPIFVYYYKTPYMLVNDGDVHDLGEDFDNAIILLATSIIRGETSQKEATTWLGMYKDDIKTLKKFHIDKIDWLPRLQPGTLISKLGGFLHPQVGFGQIGNSGSYGPSGGRGW